MPHPWKVSVLEKVLTVVRKGTISHLQERLPKAVTSSMVFATDFSAGHPYSAICFSHQGL